MFQLDQEIQDEAQDVELCSPHLEEECEEGNQAAVACGLYKLPVALKDDGGKTRSSIFLKHQRSLAGTSRTPTALYVRAL